MASLQGKVIAITGAGSGIGLATARECARRGAAALALCDVNEKGIENIVAELKGSSAHGQSNGNTSPLEVIGTKVDVSSSEQVDSWIASIVEKFGRLDCAANVAGVGALPGASVLCDLGDTTNEHWDFIMGVNLTGMFYCVRAQLRVMKEGATILNVASMAGLKGREGLGAYSTSKHGVVGLTRTAAREYAARGIRINALCPGPIDTPLLGRLRDEDSDRKGLTGTYNTIPMKRLGTAEDMAKTIIYALSDDSSYTTGAMLAADGGYCA